MLALDNDDEEKSSYRLYDILRGRIQFNPQFDTE